MGRYKKWYIRQNQSVENMLKDMAFCNFPEKLEINMVNEIIDTAKKKKQQQQQQQKTKTKQKTGIDATKIASRRVFQKQGEAYLIGNKINYFIR